MRYKLLGRSGLRVSELCLGTMTFGEDWGWGASKEECRKMFDLFANAGGNFIDTSVNYTNGTSETYVGDLVKADREHFVVATKYSLTNRPDDPNAGGNSRKNMVQSVERSLRRLQTDYIDLYYLHVWDFMTPVEEVVRGLDDLVRAGKVLYVGFSDTPAWIVAQANTLAEVRGWSRFVALQVPYSLADRSVERAELPMARHWDMAVLVWGILEAGLLTGKYTANNREPKREEGTTLSPRLQGLVKELQAVADQVGRTPSQVAINWVRQRQQALLIPILGARTEKQLKDNLACLEFALSAEQVQGLDAASKIDYGFPRSFVEGGIRQYLFGTTFDKIDNHRGNPL
jgi:aryl-alcohol dehydrogenase-like predicted oxidoreductase